MLSDKEIRAMTNCELIDLIRVLEDEIEKILKTIKKELQEYLNKNMENLFI